MIDEYEVVHLNILMIIIGSYLLLIAFYRTYFGISPCLLEFILHDCAFNCYVSTVCLLSPIWNLCPFLS